MQHFESINPAIFFIFLLLPILVHFIFQYYSEKKNENVLLNSIRDKWREAANYNDNNTLLNEFVLSFISKSQFVDKSDIYDAIKDFVGIDLNAMIVEHRFNLLQCLGRIQLSRNKFKREVCKRIM